MNDDDKEIVVNCGAFNFSAKKTAQVLAFDLKQQLKIIDDLNNDESEIKKLYETGKTRAEYEVMNKLFELARSGDIQAIKELDKKTKENRMRGF